MSLSQLLDQFVGGQQNAGAPQQQNSGGLSSITNNIPGGLMGGLAAGGLLGVLAGNKKVRKTAGKMAGGAVGLGGAAVLGAVAFNAYKNWQSGKQPSPQGQAAAPSMAASAMSVPSVRAPKPENFDTESGMANDGKPLQLALVKAMIAASNADGHIDATEQAVVFDAVNKMQLEAQDKALIFDTLQSPPSLQEIAGLANGMEQASEIYLASRLAIDPDDPREKTYLSDLASLMSLPEGLVMHLESQMHQKAIEAA